MSMLDYGAVTEHDATGRGRLIFAEFRKLCKEIGKKESELTQEELKEIQKKIENMTWD